MLKLPRNNRHPTHTVNIIQDVLDPAVRHVPDHLSGRGNIELPVVHVDEEQDSRMVRACSKAALRVKSVRKHLRGVRIFLRQ